MTDPKMRRVPALAALAALAVAIAAIAAAPSFAQKVDAERQGRRIAATYCGQCHALGSGPSPLADAPPFATLHLRYREGGGLEELLGEGMIAPAVPQEEGPPRMHPRMPQVHLDEDEVADLVAFLRSAQSFDSKHP